MLAEKSLDLTGCIWEAWISDPHSFPTHPGLTEDGSPRTGATQADWILHKNWNTVQVALPPGSEPGSLVGALSATQCWRAALLAVSRRAEI